MFRIGDERELLECFREIDRDGVVPPTELKFPLFVRDYLAWEEPSGARTYVVFADGDHRKPLGIAFRRDTGAPSPTSMCGWCHTTRDGHGVGLLTATANSKRRVGLHLCRDLSCKEQIERAAPGGGGGLDAGRTTHERVRQVIARMGEFARQQLF